MSKSQRLKDLLKESKVSQAKLAQYLGVDSSAISQFKQGTANPKQENSEKISDFFNVNLEWFLTGNGKKFRDTKDSQETKPYTTSFDNKQGNLKNLVEIEGTSNNRKEEDSPIVVLLKERILDLKEANEKLEKKLEKAEKKIEDSESRYRDTYDELLKIKANT